MKRNRGHSFRLTAAALLCFFTCLILTPRPVLGNTVTGQVYQESFTLPWEQSSRFQAAAAKAGTHLRMAYYKATLLDPLPGELFNVSHAARLVSGIIILPGEVYSQNQVLGPYTASRGYRSGPTYSGGRIITTVGGGVCKIASVTYNIIRLANLQVIQRRNHSLTVPYVPPGQDATVYYGASDFKFRNNSGGPVMLWGQTCGNTLYMAVYGQQLPPLVTWHHKILKHLPTATLYQYNPILPAGSSRVTARGQDGIIIMSWVVIKYFNGKVEKKELGRDYYGPSPRIVERGPK